MSADSSVNDITQEEDEEHFAPEKEVAAALVAEFAQITGTDTALAQMFLQDRQWDLEVGFLSFNYYVMNKLNFFKQRSLNAYFGAKQTGGLHILDDGDEPQIVLNIT